LEYPNNSNNNKNNEPKVEPVGGAQIRETRGMRLRSDAGLIWKNVLKPNAMSFLGASLHSAIDILLFPNKQQNPPGYFGGFRSSGTPYVNYSNMYVNNSTNGQVVSPLQPKQTTDYKSIVWNSEEKAQQALNGLRATIAEYGRVSINNLFDLAELSGPGKEGWNYGWVNLNSAYTTMVNGGWWVIVLPDPIRFPMN